MFILCYYKDMKLLWTWGGIFFGYQDRDNLWSYKGKHIGKFHGEEIYDPNGYYMGELKNDNRLIFNISKKNWRKTGFSPIGNRTGIVPYIGYIGYVMYVGYEDFPSPEDF